MTSRHIFLTGANGFIGSHLLRRLLDTGYFVTVLLRESSDTSRISSLIDHPNFRRISIGDMADVFASNKPDIIIHLATCYRKYHTATDISEMISTNIDLPTQIAQLAVQHGVKYYINTGTFFEYDFSDTPLQETSREQAFNLYASTKQAFNKVLKYYTEQYDFRALTIRLFSPYGPGDNEKFIPVVIRSLEKGMEMSLVNSTQRLNFTYVEDIVDAYMLAIDKIAYLKNSYEIINVAPSESTSLIDVIRVLEQISGKTLDLKIGPGTEGDIWHSSFGSQYAKEILGWEAKTPLINGLTLTLNAYKHAI